jgi:hypothetical protein
MTGTENAGAFIREKVWLENSLSQLLRNNPEDGRSHPLRGGSLKSRKPRFIYTQISVDFHGMYVTMGFLSFGLGARGGVMAKSLRYKPVGRGFESRWCYWNFSVT